MTKLMPTNVPKLAEIRREPRRYLGKQEAIRHLIHAAIRAVMNEEDPFAIHLLIQSADKMLVDLAKKQGKDLKIDWELYIKDEHHKEFFQQYRETYNYFKHADEDTEEELPVRDIAITNVMCLFICVLNYHALFKELTEHMRFLALLIQAIIPKVFDADPKSVETFEEIIKKIGNVTLTQLFLMTKNYQRTIGFSLSSEMNEDTKDSADFYAATIDQMRERKTKNTELFS